jgi:ESCRT-I complex subunit VPS37
MTANSGWVCSEPSAAHSFVSRPRGQPIGLSIGVAALQRDAISSSGPGACAKHIRQSRSSSREAERRQTSSASCTAAASQLKKMLPSPSAAAAGPPSALPLDTPLARDFPSTAQLSRQDLEQLLHGVRANQPAHQQQQPSAEAGGFEGQDAYFEAFLHSLPQVRQSIEEHEAILKANEEKARKHHFCALHFGLILIKTLCSFSGRNAELQPRLEALRRETSAYFDQARSLDAEWQVLNTSLEKIYRRFAPASLHIALTQGTSKIYDASEALAHAYVEGLPDLASGIVTPEEASGATTSTTRAQDPDTQFVRKFRELRTRYHRRALLAERWSKGTVTWRDE